MARSDYEAVIGLEIHCQLDTESKLFSSIPTSSLSAPNTNVDAIILGHPGALPVPNKSAIDSVIKMGLGTGCSIRPVSYFSRKHYFYPDLPKGFQISQYDDPICHDGSVDIEASENEEAFTIGITRIHIEEDAGKSIHDMSPAGTLLDFNRAGVPLAELVTEPDFRTPRQAFLFMKYIRQLVRYLRISDGNMQDGSLRCDANVSVRKVGATEFGTKTEIKNMNSFKHVESALEYEIERQIGVLEGGRDVVQATMLWDPTQKQTRTMRSKEDSHDYRYFKDPDLPPISVSNLEIEEFRASLPELPQARKKRYQAELGLSDYDAGVLTDEIELADYFETVVEALSEENVSSRSAVKRAVNLISTNVLGLGKELGFDVSNIPITGAQIASLVQLREARAVSSSAVAELIPLMIDTNDLAEALARRNNLIAVDSQDAIEPAVKDVVGKHPKQVEQYRAGKTSLIGFFIGAVMRDFDGSPDPIKVRELLVRELEGERD